MSRRLGPFEVRDPLVEGGMGQVWTGVHLGSGVPVVVKVVRGAQARKPSWVAAFSAEVRAIASLDHCNVARVFDYGRIPPELEAATGGRLVADSPYLVMERLDGTLETWSGRLSWPVIRGVLGQVLAGLAHAHAAGVIHRDLKPPNLLVKGRRGDMLVVKLADFGIAHTADGMAREGMFEEVFGTPEFLAPEQRAGSFRDYGPWTDLFTLGVTASRLAWGESGRPRDGERVPDGFVAWLARLLEPEPRDRFQFAAEAAAALRDVVFEEALFGSRSSTSRSDGVDLDAPTAIPDTSSGPSMLTPPVAIGWPDVPPCSVPPMRVGPMPADAPAQDDLLHAGLGVFSLRPPPYVGRVGVRQQLWDVLARVDEERRVRFVEITGPAGVGKSRLAEWICRGVHEQGAGVPLRAIHAPDPGHADGIGALLGRQLRLERLDPDAAADRVEMLLGDGESGAGLGRDEAVRVAAVGQGLAGVGASERHALTIHALTRLHRGQVLVLWLDDAQWGLDALGFARFLADLGDVPALVLLTIRAEGLAERPAEQQALSFLRARAADRYSTVELGMLDDDERRALVRHLLGLESAVALEVEERSAGNPLFTVQLIGDWIARGVLVPGQFGFRLEEGATVRVPDSLQAVWADRVARLFGSWSRAEVTAMEIAAVLGQDVDHGEWSEACAASGVTVPDARVEELLELRLARRSRRQGGFSFAHAMLREAILDRIACSGLDRVFHESCARVLERRGCSDERVATHWLAAGDLAEARLATERVARRVLSEGNSAESERWMKAWGEALDAGGFSEACPERVEWWLAEAQRHAEIGARDEALASAREAGRLADRCVVGPTVRVRIEGMLSWVHMVAGELGLAEAAARRGIELCPVDDASARASAWGNLARVLQHSGRLAEAAQAFGTARDLASLTGNHQVVGRALADMARVFLDAGDLQSVRRVFEEADALGTLLPAGRVTANLANVRGDMLRRAGDLASAERFYRQARDVYVSLGQITSVLEADLLLAILDVQRREWQSREVLTQLARRFEQLGQSLYCAVASANALAGHAAVRDWPAWLEQRDRFRRNVGTLRDRELADALVLAGEVAEAAHRFEEAREVFALAAEQLDGLNQRDAATRVRERIRRSRAS